MLITNWGIPFFTPDSGTISWHIYKSKQKSHKLFLKN